MPTLKYFAAAGRAAPLLRPQARHHHRQGARQRRGDRRRRRGRPPRADPLRRPRLRAGGARPRRRHRHQRQAQAPRAPRPRRPRPPRRRRDRASRCSPTRPLRRQRDDESSDVGPSGRAVPSELAGVRKLFAFSEKLINRRSVDELLEAMLDDVIELTSADKGFLLLIEGAEAQADRAAAKDGKGAERRLLVRASRNVRREAIVNAEGHVSDSIVRRVIDTAKGEIVSDALTDTQLRPERERHRPEALERDVRPAPLPGGGDRRALRRQRQGEAPLRPHPARAAQHLRLPGFAHPPERDAPQRPARRQGPAHGRAARTRSSARSSAPAPR